MANDSKEEMSQSDILDSIRRMVQDEKNSSVVELTDLVDDNGNIVKVNKTKASKKIQQKETDVGDFLRLIKDNEPIDSTSSDKDQLYRKESKMDEDINIDVATGGNDYIHRVVQKVVKDYLDANLPAIAKKIIEHEVVNMLRKM